MTGYNFTERVRKILAMARDEAVRLGHEYVGTEHLLLGLIREGEGVGAIALENLGIDLGGLRDRVEKFVKVGRATYDTGRDLPYTSRAKRALELSMTQARELHHSYCGSEHLLLGLIAEEKGIASQVLAQAGVDLETARGEIVGILGTERRPRPATKYEALGVQRGAPVDRVEVVLHYPDGRRFQASFASPQDAQGFLAWAAPRG